MQQQLVSQQVASVHTVATLAHANSGFWFFALHTLSLFNSGKPKKAAPITSTLARLASAP